MGAQNTNCTLKAENAQVKHRISQLDENAVRRVTAQKDAIIERLNAQLTAANENTAKLRNDYNALFSKYKYLVLQGNDLTQQPEIVEAARRVEMRKEQEAQIMREEQAKHDRYQGVLDRFISEGHDTLRAFSRSGRVNFNEKEANVIYYGIMATATKQNIALSSPKGVESAVDKFLEMLTNSLK